MSPPRIKPFFKPRIGDLRIEIQQINGINIVAPQELRVINLNLDREFPV